MTVEQKDRIMDTAQALFVKRGVRDVNIDEICHELGMSKKTFYQYYGSKEDLVGSMVDRHLEKISRTFESSLRGRNAVEVMTIIFNNRRKESFMVDKKIGDDICRYYHDTFVAHTKKASRFLKEGLIRYLDNGIRDGYIRSDIDKSAIVMLLSMLHKSIVDYMQGRTIIEGRRISGQALDNAFKDIVTHTLLTEKGWELYNGIMNEKTNSNLLI